MSLIPVNQPRRVVMRTSNGISEEYPPEAPFVAMVGLWVATLLASWALVALTVVGIWWLVT